ncbi:TetR/AcrR family transcriptional repressor of bet genes [Rhodoligotrophos appendicifer]|uniref:transcriptional regulator BetI n=1 Tax=Rhodoligotrophos appendicifer TaxID=987056 RepID=UPI00118630BB|nr:transcriptional regulator BetI [Rhodoligotrophos appendicifer]
MPKIGMAPIRRRQLIDAVIASIHDYGLADATVARIAAKAGVSAGIVHHYFKGKDDLLFETMRFLLEDLRRSAVSRLAVARTPQQRVFAIIEACLADEQFAPEVMAAWLALYGGARHSPRLRRILRIYARRLRSDLRNALKPLLPAARVASVAEGTVAMIDGLWLQYALHGAPEDPADPRRLTRDYVEAQMTLHGRVLTERQA